MDAQDKFQLEIIRNEGGQYYAVLVAATPYGTLRRGGPKATARTETAAIERVLAPLVALADWQGSLYRGAGRKPRDYRKARHVMSLLRSIGRSLD